MELAAEVFSGAGTTKKDDTPSTRPLAATDKKDISGPAREVGDLRWLAGLFTLVGEAGLEEPGLRTEVGVERGLPPPPPATSALIVEMPHSSQSCVRSSGEIVVSVFPTGFVTSDTLGQCVSWGLDLEGHARGRLVYVQSEGEVDNGHRLNAPGDSVSWADGRAWRGAIPAFAAPEFG